jgi:hypothetical protein
MLRYLWLKLLQTYLKMIEKLLLAMTHIVSQIHGAYIFWTLLLQFIRCTLMLKISMVRIASEELI